MRINESVQMVAQSVVLGVVAYKTLGWVGIMSVIGTYVAGMIAGVMVHPR